MSSSASSFSPAETASSAGLFPSLSPQVMDPDTKYGYTDTKGWFAILLFLACWLMIARNWALFPIGRTAAALVGGCLMVSANIITPDEAFKSLSGGTLLLLTGLMIILGRLEEKGLMSTLQRMLLAGGPTRSGLLLRVSLASALMGAFVMNDGAAIFLTGVIIAICEEYDLDIEPYALALATSANIGSAATIIGNPKNMIVQEQVPNIDFLAFFARMGPPALFGTLINAACLLWYYRDRLSGGRLLPRRSAIHRVRQRQDTSNESALQPRLSSSIAVNSPNVQDLTIPFANNIASYGTIGYPIVSSSSASGTSSASSSTSGSDNEDDDENLDEMERRLFSGVALDTEESSGDTDEDDDNDDKRSSNSEQIRQPNRMTSFSQFLPFSGFPIVQDDPEDDEDLMDNETTRLLRSAQRRTSSYNTLRAMALQQGSAVGSLTHLPSDVAGDNIYNSNSNINSRSNSSTRLPLHQRAMGNGEKPRGRSIVRRRSTGDSILDHKSDTRPWLEHEHDNWPPTTNIDNWQGSVAESIPRFEWPAMPARHQTDTDGDRLQVGAGGAVDGTRFSAPEISWSFIGPSPAGRPTPTARIARASRHYYGRIMKRLCKLLPAGASKWLPSLENTLFTIILLGMYLGFIYRMHLGFTCLTAGMLILLLSRSDPTRQLVENVNYPLLAYLFGIFILIAGVRRTPLPDDLWRLFRPLVQNGHRVTEAIGLLSLACALSFVFTSIPAVLLLAPRIPSMGPEWASTDGWLLLAWSVTLCGNWTPFGSVAGLVVSELCREYCQAAPGRGRWIGEFTVWWRFAWWSTCLILLTGGAIICFA
ncbi:citrate transporter-like domain-containing protein [Syncephalis plumigaleata]|nr:citrate transporter-like domain-containing protein [Syncephalis plumigaleata]